MKDNRSFSRRSLKTELNTPGTNCSLSEQEPFDHYNLVREYMRKRKLSHHLIADEVQDLERRHSRRSKLKSVTSFSTYQRAPSSHKDIVFQRQF
jgi:hypothetical protein